MEPTLSLAALLHQGMVIVGLPSENELAAARFQERHVAIIAGKLIA
jgi:hypothetical protein